jgi:hypothetical protein
MIEKYNINRKYVWLTYENIFEKNEDNLLESLGYICSFNLEEPGLISGESFKDENSKDIIFNSIEDAKKYALTRLPNDIYPHNFLSPLSYDASNVSEIMHKPILLEIGLDSDNIVKTIEGEIITCTSASNDRNLLASVRIKKANGEIEVCSVFEIQKFKIP